MEINVKRTFRDMVREGYSGSLIPIDPDRVYKYIVTSEFNMLSRALRTFPGHLYNGEAEILLLRPLSALAKIVLSDRYEKGMVQEAAQNKAQNYRVISLYLKTMMQAKTATEAVTADTLQSTDFAEALRVIAGSLPTMDAKGKDQVYTKAMLTSFSELDDPSSSASLLAKIYEISANRSMSLMAQDNLTSVAKDFKEMRSAFGISAGVPLSASQKATLFAEYVSVLNAIQFLSSQEDAGCHAEAVTMIYWFRTYLIAAGITTVEGKILSRDERVGAYTTHFAAQQLQTTANTQNDQLRLRADELLESYFLPITRVIPSIMLSMSSRIWAATLHLVEPLAKGSVWDDARSLFSRTEEKVKTKTLKFADDYVARYIDALKAHYQASDIIPAALSLFKDEEDGQPTAYAKWLQDFHDRLPIYEGGIRDLMTRTDSVMLKRLSLTSDSSPILSGLINYIRDYHYMFVDIVEMEQVLFQTVDETMIPQIQEQSLPVVLVDESLMTSQFAMPHPRAWTARDPLARTVKQWIYKNPNDPIPNGSESPNKLWISWYASQSNSKDAEPRWVGEYFILKNFWEDKYHDVMTDRGTYPIWDPGLTFVADPQMKPIMEQPIPFVYTRDRSTDKREYTIHEWEKAMFARGQEDVLSASEHLLSLIGLIHHGDKVLLQPILDALAANVLIYRKGPKSKWEILAPTVPYIWGADLSKFLEMNQLTDSELDQLLVANPDGINSTARILSISDGLDKYEYCVALHKKLPAFEMVKRASITNSEELGTEPLNDAIAGTPAIDSSLELIPYPMMKGFYIMVAKNLAQFEDNGKPRGEKIGKKGSAGEVYFWVDPIGLSPYRTCLPHLVFSLQGGEFRLMDHDFTGSSFDISSIKISSRINPLSLSLEIMLMADAALLYGDPGMWEDNLRARSIPWPSTGTVYIPFDARRQTGVEVDPGTSMGQTVDVKVPPIAKDSSVELSALSKEGYKDLDKRFDSADQAIQQILSEDASRANAPEYKMTTAGNIKVGTMHGVSSTAKETTMFAQPGVKSDDAYIRFADMYAEKVKMGASKSELEQFIKDHLPSLGLVKSTGVAVVEPSDSLSKTMSDPSLSGDEARDLEIEKSAMQSAMTDGGAGDPAEVLMAKGDDVQIARSFDDVKRLQSEGYVIISDDQKKKKGLKDSDQKGASDKTVDQ